MIWAILRYFSRILLSNLGGLLVPRQPVDDIINLRLRPSLPFCLGYEAVVNL